SGSACGPSTLWRFEVAVPVVRHFFSYGCSVSLVGTPGCSFPTSWRSGMLGACVVRLWSHVAAPVFRELLCLSGCVPRCCFHIVFDSASSARVVFGPTLSSLLPLLLEFLLLWLVRDWLSLVSLVREAHPLLSSGKDSPSQEFVPGRSWWRLVRLAWLAFQQGPSVSYRRVLLLLLGVRAASMVVVFARAAVGFVLGLRIQVVVSRRLWEPTCGVAFTVGVFARAKQMLVCRVAPLVERCDTCLWLLLRCIAWLLVFWLRYVVVVLAGAFWWVSQNGALVVLVEDLLALLLQFCLLQCFSLMVRVVWPFSFVCFDEGSSQDRPFVASGGGRLLVLLVEVLPRAALWLFWLSLLFLCVEMSYHFGAVFRTVATFVVKVVVTYCPVSCRAGIVLVRVLLVPQLCLEALVAVWCVALSTCVVSCGESSLLARVVRPLVQVCCILPDCGACGVELSASGTLCASLCLVAVPLPLWGGCFTLSSLPTSWVAWLCQTQSSSLVLPLCIVPVELLTPQSFVASEVPDVTVICVATSSSGNLSGCRGVPEGCVLVAVWAAVALRLVMRRPAPSRSGGRRLKALTGAPFPFLSFSFPFSSPRGKAFLSDDPSMERGGAGGGSCGAWSGVMERGGGVIAVVKSLWGSVLPKSVGISCSLPNPDVVCVATPRCSIPSVCLPSDVATAVRVATSEEASLWSGAILSRRGHLLRLPFLSRWYRDGLGGRDSTRLASGVSVALLACWRVPQSRVALRTF
ncbi:hypothetical protein Taro_021180, partial [Colocasia esculenta]|nr:hypothetical protein [Colocasia esculenta]